MTDSVVKQEIEKLIDTRVKLDSAFKRGYGYIIVDYSTALKDNMSARYLLTPAIQELDEDSMLPPFYTFVNKKLVLIYDSGLKKYINLHYNRTSRKKILGLIAKSIDPEQKRQSKEIINDFIEAKKRQGMPATKKIKNSDLTLIYWGFTTSIYISNTGEYLINYNINP
ncbi:hypothetical protein LT679_11495 [Mucilaginibacter roseus]|uniref:Uncharacterized protein n=1 Tax=Mucilaginibacter roseus TaxID=1528868 RepID=A0ABS8U5B3_9SPHI|nr:hypothetical protein [Mucilaginibacter roseus]MCD8741228.1 hypothetical protein [Mucilaginibacter roseus]